MSETALTVHQTARPHGFPTPGHFAFTESALPQPGPGTALVENLYWSVDPYHREMMDRDFALNAPLEGRTIGRVVDSRDPALREGEIVFHRQGWRTHTVVTPAEARAIPRFDGVPLSAHLSILGGTGRAAKAAYLTDTSATTRSSTTTRARRPSCSPRRRPPGSTSTWIGTIS